MEIESRDGARKSRREELIGRCHPFSACLPLDLVGGYARLKSEERNGP